MKKLFITRKYVLACSAADAIRLEKKQKVDDVWLQEDWFKRAIDQGMEIKDENRTGFKN